MRAPNCPYVFQTGLLGVVCLVTSEEQPVRDVVRLLAAVMLVVGDSSRSACRAGRADIWRRSDCQLQQDINGDNNSVQCIVEGLHENISSGALVRED
jgi:hypothetical protein